MGDLKDPAARLVTAVRVEKHPLFKRAAVTVDVGPVVYVLPQDAAGLRVGDAIPGSRLAAMESRCQEHGAYLQAIRFLGARDRSAQQLETHLLLKGWEPAACGRVLDRLREEGLVDDHRFAARRVAYRARTSPRGPMALARELVQSGVPRPIVQAALAVLDEEALARACLRKKAPQWRRCEGEDRRRRMMAFLQRKGFSLAICRKAAETFRAPDDD